nr:uncharacterized protein LOC126541213 [Dermacentor andersoni]
MNEGLLERYNAVIRQYLELGHAEVVPKSVPIDRATYYMPHRQVIREESLTTKLRVVFDASSHAQGFPSLNDFLDKGVNLNPELLQVLLRFRWFPVAINSDIEKAFLQIEIQETDRDASRFLWFDAIPVTQNSNIVEWRMTRVPFGSTSSPFLLMATIHHHLDNACQSWDDQSPEEIKTTWTAWCADVIQLGFIKIPRCVRDGLYEAVEKAELHIFVDASLEAYGAKRTNSDNEGRSAQAMRRDLSEKLRYRQKLVDYLWIRWKKEYLLELRALHLYSSHPSSSLQVDDVVLIEEPNISRGIWPLGRVVDVFPSQDGIIRACRVKAQHGKLIRRSVQKLYELELDNATGGRDYVEKDE